MDYSLDVTRQNTKIPIQGCLKNTILRNQAVSLDCGVPSKPITIFQTTYRPQTIPTSQHPNHD
ncbi:hypothetical protein [Neisseria sp. HMSC073G10]|uniref:hypothetical protein n=1 Tax=Neisseria sp. HMSC073G10 TaxID=1739369 RepID=UPI00114CFC73|nr:hypothetical protein [Neisseria sp. HMSC073G10]